MKQTFKLSLLLLLVAQLFFITSCEENAQSSCNNFAVSIDHDVTDSTFVTLTAVTEGGEPDFSFAWNTGATTQSIDVTEFDTYSVLVTDGNACTASIDFVIDTTQVNDPCEGFGVVVYDTLIDGSVHLEAIAYGGTWSYTYLWSTGESSSTIPVNGNGDYTVTATDANGCTVSFTYYYQQSNNCPFQLSITEGVDPVTGNVTFTASTGGGAAPYTYAWMNGEATETIDLIDGVTTYTVTVEDSDGCVVTAVYEYTPPGPCDGFEVDITASTDSMTFITTLTANTQGGTPAFDYLWSTGAITQSIDLNTMNGVWFVTVTDSEGCVDEALIQQ
ncbi:hypothetical protein N9B82_00350 [Saprospiraceae bacterium]|nr:hypothetical protein [Saprospiraceae bacterium]